MIYDCFPFFNELELLEIRLNELNNVVDRFVIAEGTKTYSNDPKPLYFNENKEKFARFLHKIEHIIVDDYPEYETSWTNEIYLRNSLNRGLVDCNPDDVIMISDLDEIPDRKKILEVKDLPGIKALDMSMYYYFLNYQNLKSPVWKSGTKILFYKDFLNCLDNYNNYSTYSVEKLDKGTTPNKIRMYNKCRHFSGGGWHFSYLGGYEKIKYKIETGSHQEYNSDEYTDTEKIRQRVTEGKDLFGRKHRYKAVKLDESFPRYILDNKEKFRDLIADCPASQDKKPSLWSKMFRF